MERKIIPLAIATTVVLLVGLPTYSQEPDKEKEKPAQQQERKKEPDRKQEADRAKPQEPRQQEPKQQERDRREPDRAQQKQDAERAKQADRQQMDKQQRDEKDRAKQDKAAQQHEQQIQRDQRNNAQRDGNRNVRRIREEDFRSHFGQEHHFHVERRDDRRFHYGGYWFELNEPWPADWRYDDDVYIDDIDGDYYLIDPFHPGLRILVVVE